MLKKRLAIKGEEPVDLGVHEQRGSLVGLKFDTLGKLMVLQSLDIGNAPVAGGKC